MAWRGVSGSRCFPLISDHQGFWDWVAIAWLVVGLVVGWVVIDMDLIVDRGGVSRACQFGLSMSESVLLSPRFWCFAEITGHGKGVAWSWFVDVALATHLHTQTKAQPQ